MSEKLQGSLPATSGKMQLRGCADRFGRDEDGAGLDWQGGRRIGTGGAGEEDNAARQDSVTSAVGHDLLAGSLRRSGRTKMLRPWGREFHESGVPGPFFSNVGGLVSVRDGHCPAAE